ncbi:MAG: hypothetical protein JWN48_2315 [Myxococcaceae bacterium]|nr:hypothetical protein [Myxococcaceae bacterium]
MPSAKQTEHFVTLFDHKFLPSGLALHASLLRHAPPFQLWIVCMDELVEQQLTALALPHVTLVPLRELETAELLRVKPTRSRGEYCWTITPFTFDAVFARDRSVERVTYLDADLFFFGSPASLLDELETSGKDVLVTEHAYAPEYDLSEKSGRFCVQFLTVRNSAGGSKVTSWWQQRCLEWCFARAEDGKYGDQKYLDQWPTLFMNEVHILAQVEQTLGPWNVRSLLGRSEGRWPVFYHFHNLRITQPSRVLLYNGYRVGGAGERLYERYLQELRVVVRRLAEHHIPVPTLPQSSTRDRLKACKNILLGRYRSVQLA